MMDAKGGSGPPVSPWSRGQPPLGIDDALIRRLYSGVQKWAYCSPPHPQHIRGHPMNWAEASEAFGKALFLNSSEAI